jgi:hypothetical protein
MVNSQEYWATKDKVVDTEQLVLRVLAFDPPSFRGYRLLLNYARSMRCSPEVVEVSWTLIRDALLLHACHGMRKPVIACAAIYLAQQLIGGADAVKSEASSSALADWWEVFDVSASELYHCCDLLLHMYEDDC